MRADGAWPLRPQAGAAWAQSAATFPYPSARRPAPAANPVVEAVQPSILPTPLSDARDAFDQGNYTRALALLRPLERAPLAPLVRCEADSLQAVAAFRVGELAEAADRAQVLMQDCDVGVEAALPLRFDALAVDVVASGELLRFERSLAALRDLLSLAARLGKLGHWVRARGSAATCFALLGDLPAGRRVLGELAGAVNGPEIERRYEATVRGNLAAVCLLLARQARLAGEEAAVAEAIEDVDAAIARSKELAGQLNDTRIAAFVQVHEAERALLVQPHPRWLAPLQDAADAAARAGQAGHVRQLQLLQAELMCACGQHEAAALLLRTLSTQLQPGHELSSRVRLHQVHARVLAALGDMGRAWAERDEAERLQALRQLRQVQAQSRFVRHRLELEHLFNRRPSSMA
jgi:hypothetical protein